MSDAEKAVIKEMAQMIEKIAQDLVAAEEAKLPAPYNLIAPQIIAPLMAALMAKVDAAVAAKLA